MEHGSGTGEGSDRDGPGKGSGLARTLRALVTGTSHLVALVEPDGTIAFVSPSVTPLLGWPAEAMVGHNVAGYIHADDIDMAMSMLAAETGAPRSGADLGPDADIAGEYRLLHRDGHWVPFEVLRNNFLADPFVAGLLVVGRPVDVRYALDEALGVLAYDSEGTDALRYMLRYLAGRLPGTSSAVLVAGTEREWIADHELSPVLASRGPWDVAMANGRPVWTDVADPAEMETVLARAARQAGFEACWCVPLPVRHPQVFSGRIPVTTGPDGVSGCLVVWTRKPGAPLVGHVGVLERVGGLAGIAIDRRREHRRLRHLVDYDQVTGALSRAGMRAVVGRSESTPRSHLVFDLDDFKEVNDRHGHAAGDEVLRRVVTRVQSVLRPHDLLVRLGGDEFLILLADRDPSVGEVVASRVAAVISEPVTLGPVTLRVGTSIGVAPFDPDVSFEEMTERADRAMYRAKQRGKDCWALWNTPPD